LLQAFGLMKWLHFILKGLNSPFADMALLISAK